ncbi:hypothetical protein [Rhodospira trueperi]|uniref:Uncharacterized protein n=1 Tax=Rhodospira trueperi TaxID=69960 RepID=A0A1G7FIE2_9PROT|nr:hypothetical protein [Rhodospira trueperi]SDE75315.1 hypothetical protein SAMN05421720_11171 [Rhodospira trueperi]
MADFLSFLLIVALFVAILVFTARKRKKRGHSRGRGWRNTSSASSGNRDDDRDDRDDRDDDDGGGDSGGDDGGGGDD